MSSNVAVSPVTITFSSLGSFLQTPIVFLSPLKNDALNQLHANVHQLFSDYLNEDSLYSPKHWVPHLTLANRIEENQFEKVYYYCLNHFDLKQGEILGVKLIEIAKDGQVKDVYQQLF